jgi:small GTP-binding protein
MSKRVFKLVILGDSAVGKTSIISSFTGENRCHKTYTPTVGTAFCPAEITVDGTRRAFDIWDTAGQELYRSLIPQYVRGADGALLIFDLTRRSSFESLTQWYEFLSNGCDDACVVVFGNKTDLEGNRAVSNDEADRFCEEQDWEYIEGSAKDGTNVQLLFETVARLCVQAETVDPVRTNGPPVENLGKSDEPKPCC